MEAADIVSYLERKLKECQRSYLATLDEARAQNQTGLRAYQSRLKQNLQKMLGFVETDDFEQQFAANPTQLRSAFAASAQEHKKLVDKVHTLEREAFAKYRNEIESAVSKALPPIANMLAGRTKQLAAVRQQDFEQNLSSLQDELKLMDQMHEQMLVLRKNDAENSLVKSYFERKKTLEQKIGAISSVCEKFSSIVSNPLHYPVSILPGNGIKTVVYACPKEDSALAKLIDRAINKALITAGAEQIEPGRSSDFRRYINFSCNGQNIAGFIRQELEKPAYNELRKANIVPSVFQVAGSGAEMLHDKENIEKKLQPEKSYNSREAAELCGLTGSYFRSLVYCRFQEIKQEHSFVDENGHRRFTQQAIDKVKKIMGQVNHRKKRISKTDAQKARKRTPLEQMVEMHRSGSSMEAICNRFGLSLSTAYRKFGQAGYFVKHRITRDYSSTKEIAMAKFPDAPRYSGEKERIRDDMIKNMISQLDNCKSIQYLGLEGPNFGSYIRLAEITGVEPVKSLIAEHDKILYNIMESLLYYHDVIEGGEIFENLNLFCGEMSDALEQNKDMKFNFVNLDYMGFFSKQKMESLGKLFENAMFMDQAVLYITLSNHARDREKLKNGHNSLPEEYKDGFGTDDQNAIVTGYLEKLAEMTGYKIKQLGVDEYKSKMTPMLFMSYRIER